MFEVQHYTLCDGWVNCWTVEDEKGKPHPQRFKTYTEALKELCDFLEEQHGDGWFSSETYDPNDFRIMEID